MMKSLNQMQKEVDDYISQFKAGYFSPLANLARLTEEVGELAREINHYYGDLFYFALLIPLVLIWQKVLMIQWRNLILEIKTDLNVNNG